MQQTREERTMPRTKPKPEPAPVSRPAGVNGPAGEVLSLSEAAAYLRLPEKEVVRLVREQELPGRQAGAEWRFLKAAIQVWLSQPLAKTAADFWDTCGGIFKDDPHLDEIVKEAYRRRGRPDTEDD
jgi:excisionase family DNA binding protein